jgi:hypothetical protein
MRNHFTIKSMFYLVSSILIFTLVDFVEHSCAQDSKGATPSAKLDFEELVADLANRNPEPSNASVDFAHATFAKDFNWGEAKRVGKSLQTLIDHFDEAWPTLVKHMNDKPYCLTAHISVSTDYDRNFSVGETCRRLLKENLTNACHGTRTKFGYNALHNPEIIRNTAEDQGKFEKWIAEQSKNGRKFYELQIEVAESAIAEVPKLNDATDERDKKDAIGDMKKDIERLRKTKKPILMSRFDQGEGFRVVLTGKD